MRIKAVLVCIVSLCILQVESMAQDYISKKVKQPSYQNNTVGSGFSNFFQRIEVEFGVSGIQSEYTYSKEEIDTTDNYYKILEHIKAEDNVLLLHGGINTYFPLSQPNAHQVYGIGLSAYGEFTEFYKPDTRLTNISIPVVFYSKFGADASFDSRTRYSWGWGLGYVASQFFLDENRSTMIGYPLVYLEGGVFATSSIKVRLSSNLGYKYRVDEPYSAEGAVPRWWLTSQYKVFPLRASLIWTPGSIGWERNSWRR